MIMLKAMLPAGVAVVALMAAPASAQDASPSPSASTTAAPSAASTPADASPVESTGPQVQEIIVTAQKRSQNLQDVPIAVTAVTASTIAASGITTIEGLATAVPGINLTRQSAATLIYVRGIGTGGGQAGQEGAIATFVDGVYQPSMSGSTFSLNNIERIEVLKGPQGTLYGRNATGGAVNVITRDPSHTPGLEANLSYGNRNTLEGSAYATAGITDSLAADMAFYYSDTDKGFGRNIVTGTRVNTRKDIAIRSKLLFEPTDRTKIVLSGDYSKNSGSFGVSFRGVQGTTRLLLGPAPDLGNYYNIQSDFDPYLATKNWGASGTIDQDFDAVRLKSITAYRDISQHQHLDLDFGPLPLFEANLFEKDWQFTQEIQLLSPARGKIQWIAGLFYLNSMNKYNRFNLFGLGFAPDIYGLSNAPRQRTKSYSVFGQATVPLGESTNLTVGARYTIDKRSLGGENAIILPDRTTIVPTLALDENKTFKKPTWRFALDHQITPAIMAYASYSRGFKSGVYNLSAPQDPVVNPETLDAFEVGLKTDLFDRRLRLNTAAYYYKYDDIQLTIIKGAGQSLLNAAKAEVYGIDVDFEAAVATSLTLRGGVNYVHGRYQKLENAPISSPNTTFPFGTTIVSGDASGNRMIRTPTFSGNVSADFHTPLAGGEFGANLSYSYSGNFTFEPDEYLRQKAFSLVNGSVRWTDPSKTYTIRAFARNMFDKKYWTQKTTSFTGYLGDPNYGRIYGIGAGVKF